jgi:hypothetical protein
MKNYNSKFSKNELAILELFKQSTFVSFSKDDFNDEQKGPAIRSLIKKGIIFKADSKGRYELVM